ncbi:MAG: hypothetical protein ACMV0Y_05120, partial [Paludibacter sp.]
YTDENGEVQVLNPKTVDSILSEKPIEQAAFEADKQIDQEISDKQIDEFLPLQPETYQDAQGTVQVQYNPETMEIEAVLIDEQSGTPMSEPYAIDKATYSQMSGKPMPEAIKTTVNEPLNDGSAPVVSNDMTENAPVQYPVNKKGEIDFDAMTVAQTYQYMVDNYGQEEAVKGLTMQETSIQGLISKNITALRKVNEALYGQLRNAQSIQEQLKIREKNKAAVTKLTDERAALDAQLAEIRALMPVVEQAPAQPEVIAVKGSNVRPEEQLRREQEAKAKEEAQETTKQKRERILKERNERAELFEMQQIPETPQKYTINVANMDLPLAPEIPINSVDWTTITENEDDMNLYSKAKLIEVIGRNNDGKLVGTVALYDEDGFVGNFEVAFNDNLAPETEQQPVIEVRSKEKNRNIINPWQKRLNNLGDAQTLEDVVLRRIAAGAKFVWNAEAPLKGLAQELGFTNKPGEREARKSMIDDKNGITPQEFTHAIYESGDIDFMGEVEYHDIYNAVIDTLLQVNSATAAMEMAERLRDSREFSMNEQAEWNSITPEEADYLESIPDDILESYLGITNFTPEQLDIIQNLQNEYYGNIDTTTTETSAVDSTQGIESETAATGTGQEISTEQSQAELDTQELDAYIASQSHNNKPTQKQKETGDYDKARINLQGYNITLETLKGEQRSGTDSNGKEWAITMNNHYGELDSTTGYDGDAIDVFVGPNPKEGQIFVIDQISTDGSFDESKVMLGFDSAEEARAAYMSNYEEGWQGFGSITPAGENFKTWLYDGKKQRKPYAEYKDTPEAVDNGQLTVDNAEKPISKHDKATAERKQRILSEGTGFDKPFGLIPVSEMKNAA